MDKVNQNGIIDEFDAEYRFLSNFYAGKTLYEGMEYPTVEHAFQAAKTNDKNERMKICKSANPGIAKRMGRKVLLRKDWEEIKEQVMYECVREKFQDEKLKQMLLNTGDAYLIEGNTWHDNCWGNCHCDKCKNIEGKNILGKILMRVREELKNGK